jgi:hypothetical protein
MSLLIQIALVSEGVAISPSEMTRVAAALSKQVQHDFLPIWKVDATVDAFLKLEDIPTDHWPIIVMKNVEGAAGYHDDDNGQPFSVVEFSSQWSITASHECLEMLADPFGRRLKSGKVPDQAVQLGVADGRVRYLVEVCDPSEAGQFGYQIGGIQVSDFYTPQFFDPVQGQGVRYSFTGAIDAPRKVLDGGYITWQDVKTKHFMQVRMFPDDFSTAVPHVLDLTSETAFEKHKTTQSLRAAVDRVTNPPLYREGLKGPSLTMARAGHDSNLEAQIARAEDIRAHINGLLKQPSESTSSSATARGTDPTRGARRARRADRSRGTGPKEPKNT